MENKMNKQIYKKSIILTGPVGSCKSLISSALAEELNMPKVELDKLRHLPSEKMILEFLNQETDPKKIEELKAQLQLRRRFPNVLSYEDMGYSLKFSQYMINYHGTVGWHSYQKQFETILLYSFFDNLDQPMIIDMGGSMGVSLDEYIDPFLEEFEQQNPDKYAEYFKRRDVIGFDKIYNLLKPFKNVFSMKLPDNYYQTMLKASSSKLNNFFTVTDQYDISAKHQIHLGGLINGKFLDLLRLEQIKNTIINFITPQSSTFATELKR